MELVNVKDFLETTEKTLCAVSNDLLYNVEVSEFHNHRDNYIDMYVCDCAPYNWADLDEWFSKNAHAYEYVNNVIANGWFDTNDVDIYEIMKIAYCEQMKEKVYDTLQTLYQCYAAKYLLEKGIEETSSKILKSMSYSLMESYIANWDDCLCC